MLSWVRERVANRWIQTRKQRGGGDCSTAAAPTPSEDDEEDETEDDGGSFIDETDDKTSSSSSQFANSAEIPCRVPSSHNSQQPQQRTVLDSAILPTKSTTNRSIRLDKHNPKLEM